MIRDVKYINPNMNRCLLSMQVQGRKNENEESDKNLKIVFDTKFKNILCVVVFSSKNRIEKKEKISEKKMN